MQKHKIWLLYAEEDLFVAKKINDPAYPIIVATFYHSQQCAEKAFKAYLVYNDVNYPRIHDLTELLSKCISLDQEFSVLTELVGDLAFITAKTRYPEDHHLALFTTSADESIRAAEKIYDFVKNKTDVIVTPQNKIRIKRTQY